MTDRNADFTVVRKTSTSNVLRNVRDAEPALLFGASIFVLVGFVDYFFNGLAVTAIIILSVIALCAAVGCIGILIQSRVENRALSGLVNSAVTVTAFSTAICGFLYATGGLDKLTFGANLGMKSAVICDVVPASCSGFAGGNELAMSEMARSEVVVLRYGSISANESANVMRNLSATGWQLPNGVAAIEMNATATGSSNVWFFFEEDAALAHAIARDTASAMGLARPLPVIDFSKSLVQTGHEEGAIAPGHVRVWLAGA